MEEKIMSNSEIISPPTKYVPDFDPEDKMAVNMKLEEMNWKI